MKKLFCISIPLILAAAFLLCGCVNGGGKEETAESAAAVTETEITGTEGTETVSEETDAKESAFAETDVTENTSVQTTADNTENVPAETGGMSYNESENEDSADFGSLFG